MIQRIERQFVRSARPLYGHLVSLFESAIARGELPSGSRLPPERELASRLQHQPHHGRQRVPRARVEGAAARLRGPRHVRLRRTPEPSGTPFAWRGKIASAALRSSDSTMRDALRHASDTRLLSLAAGEPAIDCFPDRRVSARRRSRDDARCAVGVASRADGRAACAASGDRRAVPCTRRERPGPRRRAAGARPSRPVPDRSRRRRDHRSPRLSRCHPVVSGGGRQADRLGRACTATSTSSRTRCCDIARS